MTHIITNPRVTEKASMLMEGNAYVFDVAANANKTEIKKAIFQIYKVKPVRVNMLSVKDKEIVVRGKKGIKSGGKKAVVYLKAGDKIEFI
ncbi:MAG: 50S ribosomal protein L23 [bacterium]